MAETWIPFSWYCPNCGNMVTGYQNKKGTIKVQCDSCRIVMVRTMKGKNRDTFHVFSPEDPVEKW